MSIISSWREPFVQTVHNQQREEAIAFKKTPEEKYELNRRFQKTENLYRNLVKEIDLRLDTKIADDVYQFANERLKELQKEPSTQIRRSFYEGRVSLIFRDLDNTMAMKLGRPLHRYCGCNVLERDAETQPKMNSPALIGRSSRYHVPYPIDLRIDQKLNQKSAVIYSWSYGGGHDSVQSALAQRYAAAGMHVYNVQFDDELIDCDPIWNLTGHRYSTRDLIGYLMTNNWWKTIRLINWHFSGTPKPAEEEQRIKSFASVLLTRGLPDIALSCVARYVGSMEKAGARLGIPFCNVSSDLDPLLFDLQNAGYPSHVSSRKMVRM